MVLTLFKRNKRKGNRRVEPRSLRQWLRQRVNPRYIGIGVSLLVLLAPMVWVYTLLIDAEQFPIRHLEIVQAEFRYLDRDDIGSVARPYLDDGFFNLDVAALQQAITELAWVDRVAVRRVWPDTLRVQVTEQVPLARWHTNSLLNQRGEPFTPSRETLPEGLVELTGPAGQEQAVAEMYRRSAESLAAVGLVVVRLEQNERRSWRLVADNGIEFELGRSEPHTRLRRFLSVYPRLMAGQDGGVGYVDLRYSNGFAVSWKGPNGTMKSEG